MTTATERPGLDGNHETGSVAPASMGVGVGSWWLALVGGLVGGTVAAGAAGTSTQTIYLGAVWAGTGAGLLIVVLASYLQVRRVRLAMPSAVFRRQFRLTLRRTVSWALGAYVFWFLIIEPALGHAGIKVPMLG